LGYFNDKLMAWVVDEKAEFEVYAAANSADVRCSAKFQVEGGVKWIS
jgi:hypothetical protein